MPNLIAFATLATALIALIGVLLTINSQNKRERRQWLSDRRLQAYSRLAFTTAELGAATATRGEVFNSPHMEPFMLLDSQSKWEAAHQAFNEAQWMAGLVAGNDVAKHVVALSQCVFDMNEASTRASRKGDPATGTVTEGDADALENLTRQGKSLIELRQSFAKAARSELGVNK